MAARLRPGSVARAEDLVTACVRECAGYLAALDGVPAPERVGLIAAIGELTGEYAAYEPAGDRVHGALLNVGRAALGAGEIRLARRLADSAVALRGGSGAAWRLRARVLAAEGRAGEAGHALGRATALAGSGPGPGPGSPAWRDGGVLIGVAGLRGQLAGRAVCVVAGGEELAAGGRGEEIDGYDVVIRVDSFPIHGPGTGERTDVHAVSHRSEGPAWRRRVRTRIVFGEESTAWQAALTERLVPGAQAFVGDRSLAWPLRDPALIGESWWPADAGTAFTVARLLDHLDVCGRIDLFGFALPGRLGAEELRWLLAHARVRDGLRMSLC